MSPLEERVAKLLRLSKDKGATEAEATAAMEAANRLAFKHGIELASISLDESADDITIESNEFRIEGSGHWKRDLLWCICRCMGGRGIYRKDGKVHSGTMFIYAPRETYPAILQTYRMIENWIEVESKFAAATREEMWVHGRTWRNSWIVGAVRRITQRLQEAHRSQVQEVENTNPNALVRLDNEVDKAVDKAHPRVRNSSYNNRVNLDAYGQGIKAGARANIGTPNLPGARRQLKG